MEMDKQSKGFLSAFGIGEMIPDDGSEHFLLLGLEYYQRPSAPFGEPITVQLGIKPEIAERLIQSLRKQIDLMDQRKKSPN